ncbi:MAG: hypothetical protein RLZZ244_1512 [Verrucomicrobiota bacterium]|jgi:hypothetical protein
MSRRLSLSRKDEKTLLLSGLDEFLAGVLLRVPREGAPDEASEERFFPSPTEGQDLRTEEDWEEHVRPELEARFGAARAVVASDLQGMRAGAKRGREVEIPEAHRWEWIHALNQARIALAARHRIGEGELEDGVVGGKGEMAMAVFQVQFYGVLQEWLLAGGEEEGAGA